MSFDVEDADWLEEQAEKESTSIGAIVRRTVREKRQLETSGK